MVGVEISWLKSTSFETMKLCVAKIAGRIHTPVAFLDTILRRITILPEYYYYYYYYCYYYYCYCYYYFYYYYYYYYCYYYYY